MWASLIYYWVQEVSRKGTRAPWDLNLQPAALSSLSHR
jgi:hypothetical protein